MIRKFMVAASLLALGTAANAVEHNPDPGFDSAGSWMADTGASVSGSKGVFSNVGGMKGLMISAPLIKEGHRYTWTATISGRTQGKARVMIGIDMTTAATYNPLPTVDLNGLTAIEDSWSLPIGTVPAAIPGDMGADPVGAFRFECRDGIAAVLDSVVYPGLKGRGHTHQFTGNTFINSTGTYANLRRHGGSNCGTDQAHPIVRSLYWQPAMLDGSASERIVTSWYHELYYKRHPESSRACTPGDTDAIIGTGGACVNIPNGIRFVFGYDMATHTGGPLDDVTGGPAIIKFNCGDSAGNAIDIDPVTPGVQAGSNHLSDLAGGACPLGSQINVQASAPDCWDGVNLDSSTHRAHLVNGSVLKTDHLGGLFYGCPNDHPYYIPFFQWSSFYIVDANMVAGKWHLASDEMVHGAVPGETMHVDYGSQAWKPAALAAWYTNCINGHLSGSSGNLCNGTKIAGDNGKPSTPTTNLYIPFSSLGQGTDMAANGTYSGEFTAPASGRLSIVGLDDASGNGFTGSVDSVSIVEKTTGRKGPRTITVH
jgi:hypothetical protein